MFDVTPLIRPVVQDQDPDSEYPVWFLLSEIDGTFNDKTGLSKANHWLKNHMEISNIDKELVVPIMVTRTEYEAYFTPESRKQPEGGLYPFLKERFEKQQPQPVPYAEAKKQTVQLKAHYHPIAQGVSTQHYLPQQQQ